MKVLQLDSSIPGDAPVSRQLTQQVVEGILASDPEAAVVHRELGREPVTHLIGERLALRGTDAQLLNERQVPEARFDDELIAELKAADVLVVGAPRYNFTIPTGLKAWVDRIAVAGKTFTLRREGTQKVW